jgi:hypothetical protein
MQSEEVSDADADNDDDDSLCPGCSCEALPPPVLRPANEGDRPHTKRQRTTASVRPPRRRARTSTPEAGR